MGNSMRVLLATSFSAEKVEAPKPQIVPAISQCWLAIHIQLPLSVELFRDHPERETLRSYHPFTVEFTRVLGKSRRRLAQRQPPAGELIKAYSWERDLIAILGKGVHTQRKTVEIRVLCVLDDWNSMFCIILVKHVVMRGAVSFRQSRVSPDLLRLGCPSK